MNTLLVTMINELPPSLNVASLPAGASAVLTGHHLFLDNALPPVG